MIRFDDYQCAISVFEGLLPEKDDKIIRQMLFELATWHAFAKLRLQTETTLNDLDNSTSRLGDTVRKFERKTCHNYRTKELPAEHAARTRRQARKAKNQSAAVAAPPSIQSTATSISKEKKFNMNTYKFHALGDYVASIKLFGTPDSYTSQHVSANMGVVISLTFSNRASLSIGASSTFIQLYAKEDMS